MSVCVCVFVAHEIIQDSSSWFLGSPRLPEMNFTQRWALLYAQSVFNDESIQRVSDSDRDEWRDSVDLSEMLALFHNKQHPAHANVIRVSETDPKADTRETKL